MPGEVFHIGDENAKCLLTNLSVGRCDAIEMRGKETNIGADINLEAQMQKFQDNAVGKVFDGWDKPQKNTGLAVRELIFQSAIKLPQTGELEETLKWGQPSYLTPETKSGSTVRIGLVKNSDLLGLFFHCQTNLVETFRGFYSDDLVFEGNRAIHINPAEDLQVAPLEHCIGMALTYHLHKR